MYQLGGGRKQKVFKPDFEGIDSLARHEQIQGSKTDPFDRSVFAFPPTGFLSRRGLNLH